MTWLTLFGWVAKYSTNCPTVNRNASPRCRPGHTTKTQSFGSNDNNASADFTTDAVFLSNDTTINGIHLRVLVFRILDISKNTSNPS